MDYMENVFFNLLLFFSKCDDVMYVMFCTHACVFVSSPALLPCDTFPLETHLAQQQSSAVIRRLSLDWSPGKQRPHVGNTTRCRCSQIRVHNIISTVLLCRFVYFRDILVIQSFLILIINSIYIFM